MMQQTKVIHNNDIFDGIAQIIIYAYTQIGMKKRKKKKETLWLYNTVLLLILLFYSANFHF